MNQTDLKKLKKHLTTLSDEMLDAYLCDLEMARMTLIDLNGANHPEVNDISIEMDAVGGEMLRRQKLAQNNPEPKAETPKAPLTVERLLALGDGRVDEERNFILIDKR